MLGELLLACARGRLAGPSACAGEVGDEPQQQLCQLAHAGAGGARGGEHGHVLAETALPLADGRAHALLGHEVGLRQRQHARQPREALVVCSELALDRRVVGHGVRLLAHRELGREVEHVHEQPRALDVREEVVAEPGALAGALDQAGDVRDRPAGGPRASSTPSAGSSVVNG